MKSLTLSLTLLLAFTLSTVARADDASQRAKAQQLMTMLHTERMVQQVSDNITKQIDDAADRAAGSDSTPDQKAKVADFKKQAAKMIDGRLGWAAMKPEIVDIYVKQFTEDQIDSIIAFYKSPTGAAMMEKMPLVNASFGQLGNARVKELQGTLLQAYTDLQKSMKDQTAPAATAAPAAPARTAPSLNPPPAAPTPAK
jgi:hypothetical protein